MAKGPHVVARQRNINPVIPLALAALVIVGLFAVVASLGGDGDGSGTAATTTTSSTSSTTSTSTTIAPDPITLDDLTITPFATPTLARYEVVYDVVENDLARTETLVVQRPYSSSMVATRDGETISGTATSPTQLRTYLADRQGWLAIQPELHRAAFDQHPLTTMATMLHLGLATEGGTDTVLDRPCRVFTTGQPLSAGVAVAPTETESAEACIDDAGLVLRETWTVDGAVISDRIATAVDEAPQIDPAVFDPTPAVDDAAEYAALLATEAVPADDAVIAAQQIAATPPGGYMLDGVVARTGGGGTTVGVFEVVRFFSDGISLIEVAEVSVGGGAVDLSTGNAIPVDVPDDGVGGQDAEVWFAPDFRSSTLRVGLSDSSYIEIRGVDPALLVEVYLGLTVR